MLREGLTGGLGSEKSTIAAMLRGLGAEEGSRQREASRTAILSGMLAKNS
jgi:hypothetical protein